MVASMLAVGLILGVIISHRAANTLSSITISKDGVGEEGVDHAYLIREE